MKYTKEKIKRIITYDCYIPFQVRFNEGYATDYLIIRKGNSSLLEFGFNEYNFFVYRITLVICKEYQKVPHLYSMPKDYKEGDILIDQSEEIYTDIFYCEIYLDAVKIIVSNNKVNEIIKSDNVIWELDNNDDLVSICVLDSSGKVSYNCYDVLWTNTLNRQ